MVLLAAAVVIVIAMMIDGAVILLAVKSIAAAPASMTTANDEATVAAAEEIETIATVVVASIATKADAKKAMVPPAGTVVAIKTVARSVARSAVMIAAIQQVVRSLLATMAAVIANTHVKIVTLAGKLVDSRALVAHPLAHEQGKCDPRMTWLSILSIVSPSRTPRLWRPQKHHCYDETEGSWSIYFLFGAAEIDFVVKQQSPMGNAKHCS